MRDVEQVDISPLAFHRVKKEPLPLDSSQSSNHLLRALGPEAWTRLQSRFTPVQLEAQTILHTTETQRDVVFFPERAVTCLRTMMGDGHTIENVIIGREGASWRALTSQKALAYQTQVVVGGSARAARIADVEEEARNNLAFGQALTSYSRAMFQHALQTGSCNALHGLEQRFARIVLSVFDRSQEPILPGTQQFLASLVGCERSRLTLTLSRFEKRGALEVSRGSVRLLRRSTLLESCCECYDIIRRVHVLD